MKATVLLITYNHEKYIEQAIDSILLQRDFPDYEIIIADDNSKDNTVALAKGKLSNLPNVSIVVNEKNLGITGNYEKGFSLCTGEYIFVLEGDDYWIDPYKLKRQADFLDEHPSCAMCFHPFITQTSELGTFVNPFKNENASPFDLFAINDLILNEGLIANYSVCCYRKSVLQKLPKEIFDLVTYDWMVNITVAQFGFLGRLNTPMSVYRLSETGVWSNKMLADKLGETARLIPAYDKALGYRYTGIFKAKIGLLDRQIAGISPVRPTSVKSFIPPILIHIVKLLIPPFFLNILRKT